MAYWLCRGHERRGRVHLHRWQVRAFDLKDGSRKMIYDAKAAFFAPPAVVAMSRCRPEGRRSRGRSETGAAKWTIDLGQEPLKLPGMNYGGITLHGGKLYLATCNLKASSPVCRPPCCASDQVGNENRP